MPCVVLYLPLVAPLQNSLTILGCMMEKCEKTRAAQHNAALNRNQELSVNAPEFIPKFSAPLGDWNAHQHHEGPSQVYPPQPQVFTPNSRQFPPQQQQIPFGQQHQRPQQYVYQQNRRPEFGHNSRPELGQNHHNHHANFPNHQQQQQPHVFMMNQQGSQQMGNNFHGGTAGNNQRGGIHNRLNFNAQNAEPAPVEPMPHKQVRIVLRRHVWRKTEFLSF